MIYPRNWEVQGIWGVRGIWGCRESGGVERLGGAGHRGEVCVCQAQAKVPRTCTHA